MRPTSRLVPVKPRQGVHPRDEEPPPADLLASRADEAGDGQHDQADREHARGAGQRRREARLREGAGELPSVERVERDPDDEVREQAHGERQPVGDRVEPRAAPSPSEPSQCPVTKEAGDDGRHARTPHERGGVGAPLPAGVRAEKDQRVEDAAEEREQREEDPDVVPGPRQGEHGTSSGGSTDRRAHRMIGARPPPALEREGRKERS